VGRDEFAYQEEAEAHYMRNTWESDDWKTAVAR
jgi:hypothetical protein